MRILKRCILSAAALAVSASAMAALPDPGLWAIDDEVNGQPGRGIQIERQGTSTVVLTYFGYRADGSATFSQAVGNVKATNLEAELVEYKNGMTLGGPMQSGEISRTVGTVKISFSSSTTGTISLPGEEKKDFSRFSFDRETIKKRLNNHYFYMAFGSGNGSPGEMSITAEGNNLTITERISESRTCKYSGNLRTTGATFASDGIVECTPASSSHVTNYQIRKLTVDEFGSLRGIFSRYGRASTTNEEVLVDVSLVTGQVFAENVITAPGPQLSLLAGDMNWFDVWTPSP